MDDFAYSMKYEGYNNEVIVADDLTAIFLGTGVDQKGYEVYLTNGSEKFNKVPPDDYVSFRELVGENTGDLSSTAPTTKELNNSCHTLKFQLYAILSVLCIVQSLLV